MRTSDQIPELADALSDLRIPFFVDGQTNYKKGTKKAKASTHTETNTSGEFLYRDEVRFGLGVLGACWDGDFVDDVDFSQIYELMGGFLEDLYPQDKDKNKGETSQSLSLFDKAVVRVREGESGGELDNTVHFIKKWNSVFHGKGFQNADKINR